MKHLLIGALIAGAWTNTAVAETFDWSGIYGGVSIGARWSKAKTDTPLDDWNKYFSADGANVTGGGFVGYNFQHGPWVFGPEVSVDFTGGEFKAGKRPWAFGYGSDEAYFQERFRSKATASVNARFGYAFGSFLPYVTAGYSRGWFSLMSDAVSPGYLSSHAKSDLDRNGWNIGAGTDWAITQNIIGRVAYRYNDFGKQDIVRDWARRLSQHTATLGIAYKF